MSLRDVEVFEAAEDEARLKERAPLRHSVSARRTTERHGVFEKHSEKGLTDSLAKGRRAGRP